MLLPRAPSSECAQSSRTYCIQSLAEHETAVVKAGDITHSRLQRTVSEARQSWRHKLHLLGYNADHTPTPSHPECSDVTQDPPSLLASMLSWILVLSVSLKCHSDTLTLFKSIEVRLARLAAGWAVKDLTSKLPSARLWLRQLRSIRDDIKWIVHFC